MNLPAILADLQRDEGFNGRSYHDSRGVLTIGFGRNLRDNPLTRDEATVLLTNDVQGVIGQLRGAFSWFDALSDNRQRAFVNLTFNLGLGGLFEFRKMLAAAERGDWATVSVELLSSAYAKQVGARADRVAALFTGG